MNRNNAYIRFILPLSDISDIKTSNDYHLINNRVNGNYGTINNTEVKIKQFRSSATFAGTQQQLFLGTRTSLLRHCFVEKCLLYSCNETVTILFITIESLNNLHKIIDIITSSQKQTFS